MSLSNDIPEQKSHELKAAEPVDSDIPNRFTALGPLKMLLNPVAQLTSTVMDLIGLISVALAASKLLFEKRVIIESISDLGASFNDIFDFILM